MKKLFIATMLAVATTTIAKANDLSVEFKGSPLGIGEVKKDNFTLKHFERETFGQIFATTDKLFQKPVYILANTYSEELNNSEKFFEYRLITGLNLYQTKIANIDVSLLGGLSLTDYKAQTYDEKLYRITTKNKTLAGVDFRVLANYKLNDKFNIKANANIIMPFQNVDLQTDLVYNVDKNFQALIGLSYHYFKDDYTDRKPKIQMLYPVLGFKINF